jgi:hypothetical protein
LPEQRRETFTLIAKNINSIQIKTDPITHFISRDSSIIAVSARIVSPIFPIHLTLKQIAELILEPRRSRESNRNFLMFGIFSCKSSSAILSLVFLILDFEIKGEIKVFDNNKDHVGMVDST